MSNASFGGDSLMNDMATLVRANVPECGSHFVLVRFKSATRYCGMATREKKQQEIAAPQSQGVKPHRQVARNRRIRCVSGGCGFLAHSLMDVQTLEGVPKGAL